MIRRLLLTGGLILLGQTSNVQIFLGGLLCTCWLLVVAVKRPYVAFWDNALSILLSFQLLIIILSGMALEIYRLTPLYAQDVYQRNAFGVFMVVACVMVIAAVVVAIVISVPFVRNRVLKCYQQYKKEKRKRNKQNSMEKSLEEVKVEVKPSGGGTEKKSDEKDPNKKEKEAFGGGAKTKDGMHQEIKKMESCMIQMKTSCGVIQSCLGSSNAKDRAEFIRIVTVMTKDLAVMAKGVVTENVKEQALEVQAQVESFAKKNVSGAAAVMSAIKSKTNSVKSKYLWSASEKEKETEETEKEGSEKKKEEDDSEKKKNVEVDKEETEKVVSSLTVNKIQDDSKQ